MSKHSARPYQLAATQAVYDMWNDLDDQGSPMLVMATGTGKTFTACHILAPLGGRVVWLAHREELLNQAAKTLKAAIPSASVGIVQGSRNKSSAQIVVASVDTLRNQSRLDAILEHGPIDYIVVDEAHHSTSPTHTAAIEGLRSQHTKLLGLTATPHREDGADLGEEWSIAYSYDLIRAVTEGYLTVPYATYAPIDIDMDEVELLDDDEQGAALIKAGIVEATVAAFMDEHEAKSLPNRSESRTLTARDRSTLVFCASVEQCKLTSEAIQAAGIESRYLTGKTSKTDRRNIIRQFEAGRIQVICNPTVLTEGTDLPRASCCVLARPLRSWSLFVQCCGRAMRLFDGKDEAFLLDLGGSTELHSLVSAPVLIGGSACAKSRDGVHSYLPIAGANHGECECCGGKIPCFARLGPHDFVDGHCTTCNERQCKESATGRHDFRPMSAMKKVCIDCAIEVVDPHIGMVTKRRADELVEAEWLAIPGVSPELYIVDAGQSGTLFVTGNRSEGMWRMHFIRPKQRNMREFYDVPVPTEMVRMLADDIARRSKTYQQDYPPTRKQAEYAASLGVHLVHGMTGGDLSKEISRVKAKAKAIKHELVREL